MRLIDEIAYQYKIAKIPMEERTFVRAWETAQNMPTIDAVPVVRGEWVKSDDYKGWLVCSACRDCYVDNAWVNGKKWRYCPNCGSYNGGDKS